MADRYWKINEAAQLLRVSADTLRHWERQGKLTSERTDGGHRRYSAANLAPLVAERRKISEAAALAELKGERLSEQELLNGMPVFDAEQARKDYEQWLATHPPLPLGLGALDRALPGGGGARAGWLALLQGKAASGKTAVLSQIALNLAHTHKKNVLLVTLEERQDSLLLRLGAQRKSVSPAAIDVCGALESLPESLAVVSHLPSPENSGLMTVARLEALILEHNRTRFAGASLDAVIVDQMGMLQLSGRDRLNVSYEEATAELAEELFMMAKRLDVFLLTTVQMPKGVPYGQPFELEPRYGYSRALVFFDLVYNLWRPAYDRELPMRKRKRLQNKLEIALAKNRFGSTAEQTFRFDPVSLRVRPKIESPH